MDGTSQNGSPLAGTHTEVLGHIRPVLHCLKKKKKTRSPNVSSTKRAAEVNPGVVQCGTSSECAAQECAVVLRPESSWVVMCQVSFPLMLGRTYFPEWKGLLTPLPLYLHTCALVPLRHVSMFTNMCTFPSEDRWTCYWKHWYLGT